MKVFHCTCGQTLFFENGYCLRCASELGFCPDCRNLVPLRPLGNGQYRCGDAACGVTVVKCANYEEYNVCNRCIRVEEVTAARGRVYYCDCCRYNQTIPDLSVRGNREKWYRLEAAKRRLFFDLDLVGLPHGSETEGFPPPLSFDFKADVIPATNLWRSMGEGERVYTGHAGGNITINIREADEVERERLRVDMGEAHRTLIGHFRHEIGHYYWTYLIAGKRDALFRSLYGDPFSPAYAEALETYYATGPQTDWPHRYVSAYASMHPWEDWAETFALYLDMVSALDTAYHVGFLSEEPYPLTDLNQMISTYHQLGVGLNEMSRTMGLLDLMPDILIGPVIEKMRLIHDLCQDEQQKGWSTIH